MRIALFAVLFLLGGQLVSAQESSPRSEQLDKLVAQQKEADEKFREDFAEPGDDLLQAIARYDGWPGWRFGPVFVEFAEAAPEDPSALAACRRALELCYAVGVTDRRISVVEDRAWSLLEKHHLASPEIGDFCILAGRYPSPRRVQFLETVLAGGQGGRTVQALATYGLAEIRFSQFSCCEMKELREHQPPFQVWLEENRTDQSVVADLKFENCSRFSAAAGQLYQRIQSEYSELPAGEGRGSSRGLETLGERARQRLFALEHLSIGAEAPEIDGVDLNGKPLRLSDFRGKIVLISFWFTGCGPCMAMLPQEKQLVDDLQGKPFQMLSVCNDPRLESARATASEKGMTWPNWFDGEAWTTEAAVLSRDKTGIRPAGAIARQWNVRGWPAIYVLDEKGMIRAKHLRGEGLNAMVHQLVAALEN